jgi:hypothetical protein
VPDVFTIAHISTYRGLKNPIFVQVPRLVGCKRSKHKKECITKFLVKLMVVDGSGGITSLKSVE